MKDEARRDPAPSAHLYNFMAKKRKNFDKRIAEEVASRIKEERLLDVGTEPGFIPIEVAKMNQNLGVWGIDISKTMIKLAKKNAVRAGVDNVKFEIMSAYDLKFQEEHFDLIMSFGALHHFRDPLRVFNEAYRVLKPCKEAWFYDFITDVSRKELKEFLNGLNLPYFPWEIAFRLHGLKYREWEIIKRRAEESRFREFELKKENALMKLILRKD